MSDELKARLATRRRLYERYGLAQDRSLAVDLDDTSNEEGRSPAPAPTETDQ